MARRGSYAKGVAKREEILSTALEVIARNGYRRTCVRDIAHAVGLSQAGVLHYFTSKEELFAEILRKRDEVDRATYMPEAAPGEPAFLDGFIRVIRHNADVPGLVQLYARLSIEATDPLHAAHHFFEERFRRLRAVAAEDVRRRQAAGTLPAVLDADRVATALLALADGLQTQWLTDPSIDMAAHIEHFLRLLGLTDSERAVATSAGVLVGA